MFSWRIAAIILVSGTAAQASPSDTISADRAGNLSYGSDSSSRSKTDSWLFPPSGVVSIGSQLRFLTADETLLMGKAKFTDVGLADVFFRVSVGGVAEVGGYGSFLIKQKESEENAMWQSAGLTSKVGVTDHVGTWLSGEAGALMQQNGYWYSGSFGLFGKVDIEHGVYFEGSLGVHATRLTPDNMNAETVADVAASFKTIWAAPGDFAGWIGFNYRVPVVSTGPFDIGNALGMEIGASFNVGDDFDIFASYVFTDRGDADRPETQLPILNGGFDQQQFMFGIAARFND